MPCDLWERTVKKSQSKKDARCNDNSDLDSESESGSDTLQNPKASSAKCKREEAEPQSGSKKKMRTSTQEESHIDPSAASLLSNKLLPLDIINDSDHNCPPASQQDVLAAKLVKKKGKQREQNREFGYKI